MTTPRKAGRKPLPIPFGIDFSKPLADIAAEHGVSSGTAFRWKRAAGVAPIRRGRPDGYIHPLYDALSDLEWSLGPQYVARLAGVSRQAADRAGRNRGKYPSKRHGFPS